MGADSIEFRLDGKLPFSKVKAEFNSKRSDDRSQNGHRDGYSGDFQTVNDVKDHSYKGVFADYNQAIDYCLEQAKKWEYVIAVQYRVLGDHSDAKLKALQAKLEKATQKRQHAGQLVADAIYKGKSLLVACKGCTSKLARVKLRSVNCPVCNGRLVSDTAEKRLAGLDAKVKACKEALEAYRVKLAEKHGALKWLVAGWGAC